LHLILLFKGIGSWKFGFLRGEMEFQEKYVKKAEGVSIFNVGQMLILFRDAFVWRPGQLKSKKTGLLCLPIIL